MMQFFHDMTVNPFLLTGLLAGWLASIACGLIGPYVIARRVVFLSGAIAHVAVGGLGAAIFLTTLFPQQLGWLQPIHGAMAAAIIGAIIIGWAHHRSSERMDTLIGAMWAVGMAIGLLLIKFTPGYHTELMGYLFGNIAFVPWRDVYLMLALDVVIIIAVLLLHRRFMAICLDEEHAALQGIPVLATHIILLVLVALTVICLIQIVGLILVMALLTLPAATAMRFSGRMGAAMIAALFLCMFLTSVPRIAVYGTRISPESAIVLSAAITYLAATGMCRRAGA